MRSAFERLRRNEPGGGVSPPSASDPGPAGGGSLSERVRARVAETLDAIALDAGGGASLTKVLLLADLALSRPAPRVVEIGVYRGRLLLPLAVALAEHGGEIYGIDPYSAAAAVQSDEHGVGLDLQAWPETIDWDRLHNEVAESIKRLRLGGFCHLVRARSQDAARRFPAHSIDLIHIDGNHDSAAVAADAGRYLPLVSPGGYLVLDDASWDSVRPVYEFLRTNHELVFQLYDARGFAPDGIGGNDFAVFQVLPDAPAFAGDRARPSAG